MSITLISTVTVGAGGAASIDFTSIPGTYTDLMVLYSARDSDTNGGSIYINFNGVTTNLSSRYLRNTDAGGSLSSTATAIYGRADSNDRTANTFGNGQFYIPNYASTTANKSVSVDGVEENNATSAYVGITAGLWSSTAAITSITLKGGVGNLIQNTSASLYGIQKGSSGGVTVS